MYVGATSLSPWVGEAIMNDGCYTVFCNYCGICLLWAFVSIATVWLLNRSSELLLRPKRASLWN